MASERAILRAIEALTSDVPRAEVANMPEVLQSARHATQHKNTVGVGMGYKLKGGKITGQKCLQVYVVKKKPKAKLPASELVPEVLVSGTEPVTTDVIEVGRVVPEKLVTRNPIQPGYSIGHINVTAGTFGGLVTRGRAYGALSNSHVLAAAGKGKNGDAVLYPGKADGGKPADRVAKLARFRKFTVGGAYVNTVDAAVATFDKAQLKKVRAEVKNLGVPKGTIKKATLGMAITKTGRTTATTKGKVIGVAARLQINYPGVGLVGFKNQVLCTRYSKPGDSGSLVLEQKSKKAVGLHFAGGPGGSFFNPIDTVLRAMGAKLVTKSVKLK